MPAQRHQPSRGGTPPKPYSHPGAATREPKATSDAEEARPTSTPTGPRATSLSPRLTTWFSASRVSTSMRQDTSVHRETLLTPRSAFRDAAEVASSSPRRIEFTDDDFEAADVPEVFLKLVVGRPLDPVFGQEDPIPLVRFLLKWGCLGVPRGVLLQLREWRRERKGSALHVWACGALAQDLNTCLDALRAYRDVWFFEGDNHLPTNIHHGKVGVRVFDAGWAVGFWSYGPLPSTSAHSTAPSVK